ncbi:MAG TPA: ParB N-terminal domain-containing protein [Paracoccus solventivorans]|uniref:ParB N-terminal domain-containing protein n=1 Tax=Paracoccus solventivorans TaxID=53463 RepID=A0A832QYW0_9RHOB|nr:ParB N-terminal domain-containing protein [Paracoccus solventivorans]HHW34668.1 ParB N-terminal domain-containing protein [Paracoccus solventivorans]
MTKINNPMTIQRAALVALDRIAYEDDFRFRAGSVDPAHKADLASTIKNTGKALDPVLLWQPPEDGERLVLLDGAHRVAAYQAAKWQREIPALVLVGADRRAALGAALKANSKRTLGLSQAERMDAAWRLVREPVEPRFKVREIAHLADVAARTVKYMRARFRTMHEEGTEITGSWARDRRSLPQDDEELVRMSDARRRAEIEKLAADVRDLFDRRKHPERVILCDSYAVWEAVEAALGEKAMKEMLAYLLGGDDDEANEWLEMATAGGDAADEADEGDEPEPAF